MSTWVELALPHEAEAVGARVRAAAIQVHREVGAGFREHVYQRCLAQALRDNGHQVAEYVQTSVQFRGVPIARSGEVDMIVDDLVVIELKAREALHPNHVAQVVGYLRATGLPLGMLFNFHASLLMKHGYARVVHPSFLVRRP